MKQYEKLVAQPGFKQRNFHFLVFAVYKSNKMFFIVPSSKENEDLEGFFTKLKNILFTLFIKLLIYHIYIS